MYKGHTGKEAAAIVNTEASNYLSIYLCIGSVEGHTGKEAAAVVDQEAINPEKLAYILIGVSFLIFF